MSRENADIVVFACNWDGLSCVEAAAQSRLSYPASVKVVKVNCLSRVHSGLILKAFELGANGVMLLGCESENCYFGRDESLNVKEYEKTRDILGMLGLGADRLRLAWLPRGDGKGFVKQVETFIAEVEQAG
ncbi:MAG: hydrogenase iron-sulfur subunit [Dehalococcoidia bacterium]|nr:hydrogenase iron-sulfur subunit [Dehalococcoidia bacterium]